MRKVLRKHRKLGVPLRTHLGAKRISEAESVFSKRAENLESFVYGFLTFLEINCDGDINLNILKMPAIAIKDNIHDIMTKTVISKDVLNLSVLMELSNCTRPQFCWQLTVIQLMKTEPLNIPPPPPRSIT